MVHVSEANNCGLPTGLCEPIQSHAQRHELDCDSVIETMQVMSRMSEPEDLAQAFATRVREVMPVDRAVIISRRGLQQPQYQVVLALVWSETAGIFCKTQSDGTRSAGLLAEILYKGEFQLLTDWSADPADPAFDLLGGQRSLMAFPLFENGSVAGMVVLLSPSLKPCEKWQLCALAMMTSTLDRAIRTQELARQLSVACKALDQELDRAADVQRWLLPMNLPDTAGVSLATYYRPAKKCGGDYYDVAELPGGKVGLFIADVSGKGAPAAVLMAVLRTFVQLNRSRWQNPARLLSDLNVHLCNLDLIGHYGFVTAFCGVLDTSSGLLTYSSAGHNPPRLFKNRSSQVTSLEGGRDLPLGIDASTRFSEESVSLEGGDLLLLYTDGVVEAAALEGEQFGVERLDQILLKTDADPGPHKVVQSVAQAVAEFYGDRPASDDQALVAVALSRLL